MPPSLPGSISNPASPVPSSSSSSWFPALTDCFMPNSMLENHIITQALSHELSSSSSSKDSIAPASSPLNCFIHQQQQHQQQASLYTSSNTASPSFYTPYSNTASPSFYTPYSNTASPISVSKDKPESPLTSSVAMESFGPQSTISYASQQQQSRQSFGLDSYGLNRHPSGGTNGDNNSYGLNRVSTIGSNGDNSYGLNRVSTTGINGDNNNHGLNTQSSIEHNYALNNQSIIGGDNSFGLNKNGENQTMAMGSFQTTTTNSNGEANASATILSSKGAPALSAQASTGAGAAKVGKKRSRSNKKAPITVLSADTTNFRAMVQQLTGVPSAPAMQQHYSSQLWGSSGMMPPLVKPNPALNGSANLPTLDTSAAFLGSNLTPLKSPLQDISFLQRHHHQQQQQLSSNIGSMIGLDSIQENLSHQSFKHPQKTNPIQYSTSQGQIVTSSSHLQSLASAPASMTTSGLWDLLNAGESATDGLNQTFSLDSLSQSDDGFSKLMDTWFSFDGGHGNLSPKLEIARMA